MGLLIYMLFLMSCLVLINFCDGYENYAGSGYYSGYQRYKREKFYSRPPPGMRYFRGPSYPIKGIYSPTPPPDFNSNEAMYPGPNPPGPKQQNLGDDDITNLVNYLTKQDLVKLIELANSKEKDSTLRQVVPLNGFGKSERPLNRPLESMERYRVKSFDSNNGIGGTSPGELTHNEVQDIFRSEIMNKQNYLIGPYASHINPEMDSSKHQDDRPNQEEDSLPQPVNLRESAPEFDGSSSQNTAVYVRPSQSYEVEGFGDIPLMNSHHSKLTSVSSYHVPHYTITHSTPATSSSYLPSIPIEHAPPKSAASAQSDAHLKAIKIWSNRSRGQAYTLHDDGTLSLERPKHTYGYP